jgi:hypothetical protein
LGGGLGRRRNTPVISVAVLKRRRRGKIFFHNVAWFVVNESGVGMWSLVHLALSRALARARTLSPALALALSLSLSLFESFSLSLCLFLCLSRRDTLYTVYRHCVVVWREAWLASQLIALVVVLRSTLQGLCPQEGDSTHITHTSSLRGRGFQRRVAPGGGVTVEDLDEDEEFSFTT